MDTMLLSRIRHFLAQFCNASRNSMIALMSQAAPGCRQRITPTGVQERPYPKVELGRPYMFGLLDQKSSPRKRSQFFSPFKIRTEAEAYLPGCLGKVIAVPTSPGVAARSK